MATKTIEIPVEAANDFDQAWARYSRTVDSAEFLSEWCRAAYVEAVAGALLAARAVQNGTGHAAQLGDSAHKAAIRERLENLDSELDAFLAAADRIREVRAMARVTVGLREEAARLGREVDAVQDEQVESIRARAAKLGFNLGDENE